MTGLIEIYLDNDRTYAIQMPANRLADAIAFCRTHARCWHIVRVHHQQRVVIAQTRHITGVAHD